MAEEERVVVRLSFDKGFQMLFLGRVVMGWQLGRRKGITKEDEEEGRGAERVVGVIGGEEDGETEVGREKERKSERQERGESAEGGGRKARRRQRMKRRKPEGAIIAEGEEERGQEVSKKLIYWET